MDALFDIELEVPRDELFEPMSRKLAREGIFQLPASNSAWTVIINSYCELAKLATTLIAFTRSENSDALPLRVAGLRLIADGKVGLDLATSVADVVLSVQLDTEAMPFAFFRLREAMAHDLLAEYCDGLVEALNELLEEATQVIAA